MYTSRPSRSDSRYSAPVCGFAQRTLPIASGVAAVARFAAIVSPFLFLVARTSSRRRLRSAQDLRDRLRALRGRHHVRARDAADLAQTRDQLLADRASFGRLILRRLEPLNRRLGDVHAEEVLVHPARGLRRADRADADDHREPVDDALLAQPADVRARDVEIEAELRLHEVGPGLDLRVERRSLPVRVGPTRHVGAADEELGRWIGPTPGRQRPLVAQIAREREQLPRVEVEHGLRVGLIAALRVVALEYQQIA